MEENLLDAETAAELRRVREVARYYCAWADEVDAPFVDVSDNDDCGLTGIPAPSFEPRPPRLSPDPSLTAYAQLGALKLNCERSFISLIDHDRQYVLAEATRSIALGQNVHNDGDGLFIGAQVLPVQWGVCPSTIKTFTDTRSRFSYATDNITADRTRYIIRDFTKDDLFKSRPYVVAWPFMRFYAEVPMKNRAGFVIGSYCVVDNQPRLKFGEKEVGILQEIADTVSGHLELTRAKLDYDRAERLMMGLSYFVEGQSTIRESATKATQPFETLSGRPRLKAELSGPDASEGLNHIKDSAVPPILPQEPSANSSSSTLSLDRSASASFVENIRSQTSDSPPDHDRDSAPTSAAQSDNNKAPHGPSLHIQDAAGNDSRPPLQRANSSSITASNIGNTFQRASTLIRESMDLSGVIFHDAYQSSTSKHSGANKQNGKRTQSLFDEQTSFIDQGQPSEGVPGAIVSDREAPLSLATPQSNGKSAHPVAESLCEVLGFSAKILANRQVLLPLLPVEELHKLLQLYPHGHIFNRNEAEWIPHGTGNPAGILMDNDNRSSPAFSQERTEPDDWEQAAALFEVFPKAQSVLFYPLWDSHKARWCAGCFAWTTDPKRALQEAEVTYLAAFGNSVMAELGRLEAVETGKAKTDFISNISHELRSPLHGILASAELLQESSTGPDQDGMIEMVNSCGRTLLQTMDHLLDYAKINNFAKAKTPGETSSSKATGNRPEQMGLVAEFDLQKLVEEVVEVVYTGYSYQRQLKTNFPDGEPKDLDRASHTEEAVLVFLDVAKSPGWTFISEPGAWRRLIMNLFGNALKYTTRGFVRVQIHTSDMEGAGQRMAMVHFSVTDTGKGISDDYLKHRLFTPFSQEDHLAVGAGLGLSIVKQIVQQMNGKIDIESEISSGTTVTVAIPLERSTRPPTIGTRMPFSRLQTSFCGLTLCIIALDVMLDLEEMPTGILSQVARRRVALKSSLTRCLTEWFGLNVVSATSFGLARADIYLAEEDFLRPLLESCDEAQIPSPFPAAPIIMLCTDSRAGSQPPRELRNGLISLSQPYTPSKMARALDSCLLYRQKASISQDSQQVSNAVPKSTVILPRELGKASFATDVLSSPEMAGIKSVPGISTKLPRILLVDDNEINVKIMVTYMRKLKCPHATASDGLQAVELYKKEAAADASFDIVLMDLSMPVMDGLTATREIRAFELADNLPPATIIALTGLGATKTRQEASASGIDVFLTKPVPLKFIKELVGIT